MRNRLLSLLFFLVAVNWTASADDTFGTGANQFTIEFVTVSGDASSANGTNISQFQPGQSGHKIFADPGNFRIGKFEVINCQWDKFKNAYGAVTGDPSGAYDLDPSWVDADVPTNNVSWYEAAQFVNWLNTSKGYQAAYNFIGTKGAGDYTFVPWEMSDAGYNADNPYRNSNAFYFLPTEDEWVKAAYWNGTDLQTWATKSGESPFKGDGTSGTGWNYDSTDPYGPWAVGSGSEELNGTFDIMGNVWEWMEGPRNIGKYESGSYRCVRGASFNNHVDSLKSSYRIGSYPYSEYHDLGFRVASVPEPATICLLGLGGLALRCAKSKHTDQVS